MTRGRFITFEGGEGAGKSTQSRLLAEALKTQGLEVVLTREPGGTPGAEAIRDLLLFPPGSEWSAQAEALLFAAARSDHVSRIIRPALAEGRWVLCDRYLDSTLAYQGGAGGVSEEEIRQLHQFGSGGLLPDLTILIEIPQTIADERLSSRDGNTIDAIGGRGGDYHRKVAEAFARLARSEPDRFAIVDGSGAKEETHARILSRVSALMDADQ